MKVKIAIVAVILFFGGCAVKKGLEFKNSPTGQVIQQLQEKKKSLRTYKNHHYNSQPNYNLRKTNAYH